METEVEEGEACFEENDKDIDPDTALSYIDKRLQSLLGHFQKDFEGGVSAESLGPRFGGYGTFLPSYKNPPPVHSHSKAPNPNKMSSPNTFRLEGASASLNPVTCTDVSDDQNVSSADVIASKDTSLSHGETCFNKKKTATNKSVNPTEQRSLKVRIKVGYDKSSLKIDEIYSGLGLLTPSSSTGNNTEVGGGLPVGSRDTPFASPAGILGDMTSIFVPGNRLLSPLNESLMCLKSKAKASLLNKSAGFEDNKAPVSERGMKTASVDCKQGFVNDFKVKPSSDSVISEANRADKKDVPLKKRETKRELVSDQLFGREFTSKGSDESCVQKNVKKLSSDSTISEANRAAKKDVPLKKRKTKKEPISDVLSGPDFTSKESDESYEQKNDKKLSLDSRGIRHIVCKNDPDVIKHETDLSEKKVRPKMLKNIEKLPSERKNKLMGIQTKENSRSSLSGGMKDKKSVLKDIVKVRNSYKDILDTDGAIEVAHVERMGIPAEVAVPRQTEVGISAEVAAPQQIGVAPAVPPDNWVGCDRCEKWRLLPIGVEPDNLPDKWLCSMSTWLPGRNHCDISEDETTRAVQEMNLQLIFQNQNNLQDNRSRGNIGYSDHTNSNVNFDPMANKFEKIKSRPAGSGSSLIDTSHSSMDVQQHSRQKRKGLTETSQTLLEKNGAVKAKKLKSDTWTDQHEIVTSNMINGDLRPKDRLVISVKGHTENAPVSMKSKLSDKKVEIPAKKRKLKDWQESQPCANTLESSEDRIKVKDKRLKTEVKESTDDVSFNKGKTMKIRLSTSKESLIDTNHEKLSDKKVEIHAKKRKLKDWQESQPNANALESSKDKRLKTAVKDSKDDRSFNQGRTMKIRLSASKENLVDSKKDLEFERAMLVATSSSSKISDSGRKASVQERKGSPARSVSSSSIRALNPDNISPAAGKTIPRKAVRTEIPRKDIDASQSQRSGGKADVKHKESSKIRSSHIMSMKGDANGAKDKDERSNFEKITENTSDPLTGQLNMLTRVEVDGGAKTVNNGDTCITEMNPAVKKDVKKVFVSDMSNAKDSVEPKVEVQAFDGSGQNLSKVVKHPGDAANQNAKSVVTNCGTIKDLSVVSFLKEFSSSQTALTPFKRAEESKDYADRLKISGFDYECNDAYFDSALKYLYAASLLEVCTADISKSKGVDPISGYTTSAKLSKICALEYEKRKETAAAALAYKCMEVAYMRIVYCKSLLTKQDLQTSMQMVTQGESPSSSASDVDNLNNPVTMDKTLLSKNIVPLGNTLVVKNQANLMRLLDLTSDVSLAMEASTKSQNAYKAASAILEESPNNETLILVRRVVDFSFQDVKEIVCLVQNTREAINRQGFKGNNRR
ncbi:putative transcription factor & chromatin remodeling CW-Zn family [Helianthus anomalus]